MLNRLARIVTWPCVAALAVLSLLPASQMIRTGFSGDLEHIVAYLITAAAAAIGYGARTGYVPLASALAAYAGLLEVGQLWVPGRNASMVDFAASTLGVFIGTGLVALARRPH